MNRDQANRSIECSVRECAYHSNHEDYCALDSIKVGSHEPRTDSKECTDCDSFDPKE